MSALIGTNMSAKLGEGCRKRNDTKKLYQFRCTGCGAVTRVEISGDEPHPRACVDCHAPILLVDVVKKTYHIGILKGGGRKHRPGGKHK